MKKDRIPVEDLVYHYDCNGGQNLKIKCDLDPNYFIPLRLSRSDALIAQKRMRELIKNDRVRCFKELVAENKRLEASNTTLIQINKQLRKKILNLEFGDFEERKLQKLKTKNLDKMGYEAKWHTKSE